MSTTDPTETVACERCGRTADLPRPGWLPEGWEGSVNMEAPPGYGPVCPGCQYVEWHPHCTSLVYGATGERVDPRVDWADMPRDEWDFDQLDRCEYIDLKVAWTDDDEPPAEWRCPRCGGTDFEGVHRDYPPSGLQPGTFRLELRDGDAED